MGLGSNQFVFDEIDEVEYFQGDKNRLTMNQTYTWEFQCQYKLQHYPFDTQVDSQGKNGLQPPYINPCRIVLRGAHIVLAVTGL